MRGVNRKPLVIGCIVVAVLSVAVAIAYFVDSRTKHGIAFLGLAVVLAAAAWMLSGPSQET